MENVGIFFTIWSILRLLEIIYGHFVCFVVIWYMFSRFGMLYQEKSGNPAQDLILDFVQTDKFIVCQFFAIFFFVSFFQSKRLPLCSRVKPNSFKEKRSCFVVGRA
jgi:hypothetical protein